MLPTAKTSTQDCLLDWLEERRRFARLRVTECPLADLSEWHVSRGALRHRTGRYFSIAGLRSESGAGREATEAQPFILQPEVGILGFVTRITDSREVQLLVQAKAEPGNVGDVQIAPTVQATLSNYMRVHGGAATPYLEHFLPESSGKSLLDSLQSEQGTRFLGKYNRNAMAVIDDDLPNGGACWRWVNATELLEFVSHDFTINTDSRSVLVCAPWEHLASPGLPFERQAGHSGFAAALAKSCAEVTRNDVIDLMQQWRASSSQVVTLLEDDEFGEFLARFAHGGNPPPGLPKIHGFQVEVEGREVSAWNQPLLSAPEEERIVLICQQIAGVLRFLFTARREPGFTNQLQLGPSIQGSPAEIARCPIAEWLDELVTREHVGCLQSDEGGRFYQQVARYSIVEVEDGAACREFPESAWLTLGEIRGLLREEGCFSNEARSALSLLLHYLA